MGYWNIQQIRDMGYWNIQQIDTFAFELFLAVGDVSTVYTLRATRMIMKTKLNGNRYMNQPYLYQHTMYLVPIVQCLESHTCMGIIIHTCCLQNI
jgi:uracil-DNA glycosylase